MDGWVLTEAKGRHDSLLTSPQNGIDGRRAERAPDSHGEKADEGIHGRESTNLSLSLVMSSGEATRAPMAGYGVARHHHHHHHHHIMPRPRAAHLRRQAQYENLDHCAADRSLLLADRNQPETQETASCRHLRLTTPSLRCAPGHVTDLTPRCSQTSYRTALTRAWTTSRRNH